MVTTTGRLLQLLQRLLLVSMFFNAIVPCRSVTLSPNNGDQKKNRQQHRGQQQQPTSSRRPNILFIMTDQQRFDMLRFVQDELMGYKNYTKIRTPNLDKLASRGAYFRNAYTQCAVCAPARTSIRTGCTIERTGVQHNDYLYLERRPEGSSPPNLLQKRIQALRGLDQILADQGEYISEYYGKWHMPSSLYQAASDANGTGEEEYVVRYNDYDYNRDEFFFRSDTTNGQKIRTYLKYFQSKGLISKTLAEGQQQDTFTKYPYTPISRVDARYGKSTGTPLTTAQGLFSPHEITQPNVVGKYGLSAIYTPTHLTGNVALKALQRLMTTQQQQSDGSSPPTPWFLTISFHSPHPPMVPAPQYLEYYWKNRDTLFVSPNINDTLDNADYNQGPLANKLYTNPQLVQEWTAAYYALIEEVDDWVGTILQQLDTTAATSDTNTLVIFTSDHGEMLGAHGKREKNTFYEESSHIPLLMATYGGNNGNNGNNEDEDGSSMMIESGLVVDQVVSHIDIFATILDYAGYSDLDDSDGSSLRPLLEGKSYNENYDEDVVVSEWDFRKVLGNNNYEGEGGATTKLSREIDERPSLMVRKGDWKLMIHRIASSKKIDMMFHLQNDPYEIDNKLGKNAATASAETLMKAEHLRCLLLEWMERMDHGHGNGHGPDGAAGGYYSNPIGNFGQGNGDIWEVQQRQSWPALDFWMSHPNQLRFAGEGTWIGNRYTRNEYLYFGTRTTPSTGGDGDDLVLISNISVEGRDAKFFSLEKTQLGILQKNTCYRIRVTYETPTLPTFPLAMMNALIRIQRHSNNGQQQPDITISMLVDRPTSNLRLNNNNIGRQQKTMPPRQDIPSQYPTGRPPPSQSPSTTTSPSERPSQKPTTAPPIAGLLYTSTVVHGLNSLFGGGSGSPNNHVSVPAGSPLVLNP